LSSSGSVDNTKELTQKLTESEEKNKALYNRLNELEKIFDEQCSKFNVIQEQLKDYVYEKMEKDKN